MCSLGLFPFATPKYKVRIQELWQLSDEEVVLQYLVGPVGGLVVSLVYSY
jgi:hypothetical protein